jgi:NAD(P)-dependent dehydrogenase (short-subunit alcohol dehydrogenase family)
MQYDHERPRTALVAGGTGALGSAVVEVLLGRGERVCVPFRGDARAQQLRSAHAEEIADGRLRLSQCDVADPDQVAALLDVLRADWGPLWLACSTVGAWAGGERVDELADFSQLDRMLLTNLRTATVVAAEGLRHMGPAGGRVVLTSAKAGVLPLAGQASYNAAKAGVLALTATLAKELAGSGRTANVIVPDVIETPANHEMLPNREHWLPPRAIAKVVAWLGSAESWPVNGAAIPVSA